jgi:light-regulated signal transduction histidine kinase (bacteriophytochrome)
LALQSAGGGAWDLDLRSNEAWWSPEMYRLWGVAPNDSIDLEASFARIDWRDRETVRHELRQAIGGHRPYRCEFRLNRAEQERWMLSSGRVHYDREGVAEKVTGITLEVTDRKAVETSLRKTNAALERSNLELQQFAHLASHDLQTPLRSIASFAELLVSRHGDQLCTEARTWLIRIGDAATQLHLIVRDLLQWSRLSTQAAPFTAVNMQSVITQCLTLLGKQIESTGAQISYSALPTVMGNSLLLTQLVFNLLDNALKFRGSSCPQIHIESRDFSEGYELSIRDNGIGIDPHHCRRIFEMFERLHPSQAYSGTGAGLAICQRILERHGGRIWVDSMPGMGSVFRFTLPALTASPE